MRTSLRSQKLSGTIQKHLLPIIQRFITPDQTGMLTVTQIDISGDLGVADVYVRSFGGGPNCIKHLNGLSKKIAYELSHVIETRRPIILRFKYDTTAELFEKINQKL